MSVPADRFTYNKNTRMWVTEISDLNCNPFGQGNVVLLQQGNMITPFHPIGVDQSRDGEIMGWRLRSQDGQGMLIIND